MQVEIELTPHPIEPKPSLPAEFVGVAGAVVEFTGLVRADEAGRPIVALQYEAYTTMAERVMHDLIAELASRHPCAWVRVIHRVGVVPVGQAAIWIAAAAPHRAAAFGMATEFLERLKRDVPIWKRRSLAQAEVNPLRPV